MNFSVIIPTKDRKEIIEKSLNSLGSVNNIKDIEVIIVNDSESPLKVDLSLFPTKYQVLRNPAKGVASARNFGASKATNEWLVFMDDDMVVKPDSFNKLIPVIQSHGKQSCFNINWIYPEEIKALYNASPFLRYLHYYGFDSLKGWSNDTNWKDDAIFKVNGITSQFLVMHKNIFQQVGGYNSNFPLAGFEDHDIAKKLKNNGVEFYVDPQNIIFHNEEDRMQIENWLERKKRGGITRKVAVGLGYDELSLQYSAIKKSIYNSVYSSRKIILSVLSKWPQTRALDKSYFLLVNILLGAYSYAGYTGKNSQSITNAR